MKIKRIFYTSRFEKKFKKLPKKIRLKAIEKQKVFVTDPYQSSLKTYQLTGELTGKFSFSINRAYRIMFVVENNEEVTFIDIGTHSIYA